MQGYNNCVTSNTIVDCSGLLQSQCVTHYHYRKLKGAISWIDHAIQTERHSEIKCEKKMRALNQQKCCNWRMEHFGFATRRNKNSRSDSLPSKITVFSVTTYHLDLTHCL